MIPPPHWTGGGHLAGGACPRHLVTWGHLPGATCQGPPGVTAHTPALGLTLQRRVTAHTPALGLTLQRRVTAHHPAFGHRQVQHLADNPNPNPNPNLTGRYSTLLTSENPQPAGTPKRSSLGGEALLLMSTPQQPTPYGVSFVSEQSLAAEVTLIAIPCTHATLQAHALNLRCDPMHEPYP
eukprot:scaffold116373_cov45-Phaeocystis_antarctica.AAC.3